MANFFTRALDKITPWNRGGEVQRNFQSKKKKEEEQANKDIYRSLGGNPNLQPNTIRKTSQTPTPQQPTNIFETLNKNLTLGQQKPGVVPVFKTPDTQPVAPLKPGMIVKPKQNLLDKVRDQFDANTAADRYRRAQKESQQLTDTGVDTVTADRIATSNMGTPKRDTLQEDYATRARNLGSVGSNVVGGLLGMVKGTVELPSFAMRAPQLIRYGAAKITGNEEAEQNIGNDRGILAQGAEKYDKFVNPATSRLTSAELFTDKTAQNLAPWQPNIAKNTAKASTNIIPFDAVIAGLAALSKFRNLRRAQQLGAEAETNIGAVGASGTVPNTVRIPVRQGIPVTEAKTIPVRQGIPIDAPVTDPTRIPVNVVQTPQGPLIREFPGDAAVATPDSVVAEKIAEAQRASAEAINNSARPDATVEGITPQAPNKPFTLNPETVVTDQAQIVQDYADMLRGVGEGNGVKLIPDGAAYGSGKKRVSNNYRSPGVGSKRMTKAAWLEEAKKQLDAGNGEPSLQKAFNDAADPEVQALLSKGEQAPAPEGRPITVKEVKGIDVRDETVVPQNLPETPGTVRATAATAPSNARSEVIANQPTVAPVKQPSEAPVTTKTPEPIIPKVGTVMPDGTKVTKRMVQAARNQRKNARALAKAQEDKSAAMERIKASKTNPGAGQREGYAPTGEYVTGRHGNVSEKATNATEASAGAREMENRSVDDLLDEISSKESFTPGDRRRITAAKENLMKADPEGFRTSERYKILDDLEKASRSELGRGLALIPRTIRKISNSDTITARWERKVGNVLDDPSKMTKEQWTTVQEANDAFTTARDKAAKLEEQFRKTGSEADFNAWEAAHKVARDADTAAKMTEVKVAQQVLKGEKGANVTKTIDALKKEADVNTMDFVTANMLSGTGTGFRNTFGTELAGIENRVGANLRAKVTKGIFGENVGGFDRKGARFGRKLGATKWFGDAGRRGAQGGKNPIEWSKNWSTTINSAGESSLQSQVYSRLAKYYKNQFVEQGITGKALDLRMRHAMITDPDNMGDIYLDATMRSSGLTGMFEKGQTIEKAVTDYVGRHTDSKVAQGTSKLIMRMLVGFPTATTNFLYQSGKRMLLGTPSYIESGLKAAKGDKMAAALAFERGMKETGSGAAMYGIGAMMGAAGLISGPYPTDPDERAQWERDGVSENSMKIGGAWYPIPQGAGMFGLPIMLGAAIGREGDSNESVKEMFTPKNLAKLLPTDQIQGALNTMTGDESPQALKNMLASSVRAATPMGALLNQISKSFDSTKNDTTTKDFWANTLDQIYSGIPGVNNMANIPDKLDDGGNPIQNPNPVQLAFGATSASQGSGEQRSAELDAKVKSALDQIDQYGLLKDKNLDGVLEGNALEAYTKATQNRKLDESDIKALKEGLVKGVSSEGTDTAYLEKGQYDTNLAVLKMKRDLMNEDKTTKPSSLKDIDSAIKRGEVYKKDKVPYELISELKSVGVDQWRKMGIPPEDEDYDPESYDPEMYQKLWDLDRKLTEAGASLGKDLDKPKYTAKKKKTGGGGSGSRKIDTSFGTLKDGSFAPKVQEYAGIDQKAGSVPTIRTVRPNIVHKIGSGR